MYCLFFSFCFSCLLTNVLSVQVLRVDIHSVLSLRTVTIYHARWKGDKVTPSMLLLAAVRIDIVLLIQYCILIFCCVTFFFLIFTVVDSQTSKAVVHGIIAGVPVPYAIDNDNGCDSGISCPIKTKQQYSYVTRLPVKQVYPSVSSLLVYTTTLNFLFKKLLKCCLSDYLKHGKKLHFKLVPSILKCLLNPFIAPFWYLLKAKI